MNPVVMQAQGDILPIPYQGSYSYFLCLLFLNQDSTYKDSLVYRCLTGNDSNPGCSSEKNAGVTKSIMVQ